MAKRDRPECDWTLQLYHRTFCRQTRCRLQWQQQRKWVKSFWFHDGSLATEMNKNLWVFINVWNKTVNRQSVIKNRDCLLMTFVVFEKWFLGNKTSCWVLIGLSDLSYEFIMKNGFLNFSFRVKFFYFMSERSLTKIITSLLFSIFTVPLLGR